MREPPISPGVGVIGHGRLFFGGKYLGPATVSVAPPVDWYARRAELEPGQIFRLRDGSVVQLDRTVPGDATAWYVADRFADTWTHDDNRVEPGDLAERLPDNYGGES